MASKIFVAAVLLLAFLPPIYFQYIERRDRHGCLGYFPIYSILFSIPMICVGIVTILIEKRRLWEKGKFWELLVSCLAVYPLVAVGVFLVIYDFDLSELLLLRSFEFYPVAGMHIVAVFLLSMLFRLFLWLMHRKGKLQPQPPPLDSGDYWMGTGD